MDDFRFSCNVSGVRSLAELIETCRRAEQLGYDTVFAAASAGISSATSPAEPRNVPPVHRR